METKRKTWQHPNREHNQHHSFYSSWSPWNFNPTPKTTHIHTPHSVSYSKHSSQLLLKKQEVSSLVSSLHSLFSKIRTSWRRNLWVSYNSFFVIISLFFIFFHLGMIMMIILFDWMYNGKVYKAKDKEFVEFVALKKIRIEEMKKDGVCFLFF